jgi:hypothetical protein
MVNFGEELFKKWDYDRPGHLHSNFTDADEKLVMRLATSALPLIWQQNPSTVEQHRAEVIPR